MGLLYLLLRTLPPAGRIQFADYVKEALDSTLQLLRSMSRMSVQSAAALAPLFSNPTHLGQIHDLLHRMADFQSRTFCSLRVALRQLLSMGTSLVSGGPFLQV